MAEKCSDLTCLSYLGTVFMSYDVMCVPYIQLAIFIVNLNTHVVYPIDHCLLFVMV